MQTCHMPRVNARYWIAINLASLFGTNMGDLYVHTTGLPIVPGLAILAVLVLVVFLAERRDRLTHEVYYWLAIIIFRTGATNIADYLAFRVRVPPATLTLGLALTLACFACIAARTRGAQIGAAPETRMPRTGAAYWAAMLTAGVFGTVVGDICSHAVGEGPASIGLLLLLLLALLLWHNGGGRFWFYWLAVAVARTAGTSMGDFLAENRTLGFGLPLSTLITGTAFVAVLSGWTRIARSPRAA